MRIETLAHLFSFQLHTFSLPKASLYLKHTSARRKSEHWLGTFKTGDEKESFLLPLQIFSFLSLSLTSRSFCLKF
jgi:hypothetical protein